MLPSLSRWVSRSDGVVEKTAGPCYPKGLLRGEDKFVRHIRLQKPHIDEPAFRALLKQAALWQSPRLT